jgi:hypothetical protein
MKTPIIITAIAFVFLIGCSKTDSTPAKTKTEIITKTWNVQQLDGEIGTLKVTAYTKGATNNIVDFSKFQFVFTADGKYTQTDQNSTKTNGTWVFTNNEANIALTDGTTKTVATWNLDTITDTSLILKHNIDGGNPSAFDVLIIQYAKSVGFDATKNSSLTVKLTP